MMGCSITGGTEATVRDDQGDDTGLVSGHAYSIQECYEIKDEKGQLQRLLRIRNPWGKA